MEYLRIGIAGLGTVGCSVVKIINQQAEMLATRSGKKIVMSAVTARSANKNRGINLDGIRWVDDALMLTSDDNIDVVVELIGGADGVAYELVKTAILNKKHVVTANKALLSKHWEELTRLAAENGVALNFEAAVAGGIPIIKAIREGLSANSFKAVYGILNGTCNYILTEMWKKGLDFETALKQAQDAGYAEADPSFDVDGIDAGHKLSILTALAFTGSADFNQIEIEGLRSISELDISYAKELGYKIKLLAISKKEEAGIVQVVSPCMIPEDASIANVEGALNAVFIDGNNVGETLYVGAGAGGDATASAVIADIIDIARGNIFTQDIYVESKNYAPKETHLGSFYIRLTVKDVPGVMADVTAILRDCEVSMQSILQYGRTESETAPLVLTTHKTKEVGIRQAIKLLKELDCVIEEPCLLRIELI